MSGKMGEGWDKGEGYGWEIGGRVGKVCVWGGGYG